MAERMVSPAVFTNENDLSYLPSGIGEIGGAIIGPTEKGRAFYPTKVISNAEYIAKFGGKTEDTYVPHCVESYMKDAGNITVIKLLGKTGYEENTIPFIINTITGSYLAGVLHPSRTVDSDTDFKDTFLTSSSLSSSYNGYDYSSVMTSLNANINRGGTILVSNFTGSATGNIYSANADGTVFTASNSTVYASGSVSGSVIGSIIGIINGTPVTASSYTFTGSLFSGSLAGSVSLNIIDGAIITGSILNSATFINGTFTLENGTISGSVNNVVAHFTSSIIPQSTGGSFTLGSNIIFANDFYFKLSDEWLHVSMDPSSVNYIGKVFGYNANTTLNTTLAEDKDKAYNYLLFKNNLTTLIGLDSNATLSTGSATIDLDAVEYTNAETPWITSQLISNRSYNLFKIATLSDGNYSNKEIKVGILNVKKSGEIGGTDYGSFGLVVRVVDDNDKQQQVLETYSDLSLDPDSPNYICRVIGDKYPIFTVDEYGMSRITMYGDYDNKSNYIRIIVDDNVKYKAYDASLVPFGFRAYKTPFNAVNLYGNSVNIPTVAYITDQTYNSEYNSRVYYGFNTLFTQCDNDYYLNPLPSGSSTGSNYDFNLDNMFGNTDSGYTGSLSGSDSLLSQRKFILAFQGGFDGWSPSRPKLMGSEMLNTNTMGLDCSTSTAAGSKLYEYALGLLSNDDEFDINLLLTPGIVKQLHPSIINKGIDMCEQRGDVLYIFDLCKLTEINLGTIVNETIGLDTSYAATYHPWLKILNSDTNKTMWVPPSVLLAGVIAYNDKVAYEWFAPAGLNRGGITEAVDIYTKLYRSDRDTLYENKINPIASFPKEGIAVWGQKTLQVKASALDRINVRRLLIAAKKYIASSSRYLLFDNNTNALRNQFLAIANPYFESIQQRQGLYTFKVVCDTTNNEGATIDRNQLKGSIWLQPAKSVEIIIIDFNITPTGATFGQ